MEISSFTSAQVAQLQQTLQMSILDKLITQGATSVIEILDNMSAPQITSHPYKGQAIDVQV